MYSASISAMAAPTTVFNVWELQASASASLLIHSISIEIAPVAPQGLPLDLRIDYQIARLSALGSGGTPIQPVKELSRNTQPSGAALTSRVTTPGVVSVVLMADSVSITVPYTPIGAPLLGPNQQKLLIPIGGMLGIGILTNLGGSVWNLPSHLYHQIRGALICTF